MTEPAIAAVLAATATIPATASFVVGSSAATTATITAAVASVSCCADSSVQQHLAAAFGD